ncbi:hypothetical protein E8E13_010243 [Curvularia kusanoi]|uniref:Uncharacterized protein n=1 Tax=Curvularia kusanoi TaxID=90978 RepID=A0A9P4WD17_CURKU|nr:hypothetical protein E8E13_010243 [Curvularia kusanoi]
MISGFISLGFILGSFYKLAVTQTYDSVLNNLHTSAETITSDDGSSNLTISWINGRATSLNATYFLSTTLASTTEEAAPDAYAFILHWNQEFGDTGQGSRLKSVVTVPVPSFSEELVHSAALLSLFSILYLLFLFLLKVISRRWHDREETGIYWTSALLQTFDKVRRWIAFVASAIITALAWTAAMRALLLA